ncbi:hypothetical protein CJF32_00003625 [Rutstroemia sp. NJR-2017a WRK4]|nr:hypothetical protein CJF32_00003625 [Rutstroemia sp. NJR-2017a WRK4]
MSPSRGTAHASASPSQTTSPSPSSDLTPTENTANLRSSHALTSLKQNINYLIAPSSPNAPRPARLRTRALLRSLHYISVFVFWRVIRYAKYAAVGSIVAALSATTIGSFATGIGWVVAPTGILGCVGMGLVWWVGKWAFRRTRVGRRMEEGLVRRGVEEERRDAKMERAEGVRGTGEWRDVTGPKAVPW